MPLSGRTAAAVAQQLGLSKQSRMLKFRNRPCEVEGIWFQSTAEAKRYCDLRILERAGKIRDVQRQVPFELHTPNTARYLGKHLVDFAYTEVESGERIYEEVKGVDHRFGAWKRAHVEGQYRITIRVIR